MLKKSTADQIQLISKNRQQKKSSQMKNYETAEKKRILQQKKMDEKLTTISNFLRSVKNNFNRILLDEKMGDYELQICNKNVSSPLEHSYGLMLKKKEKKIIAKIEIIAYKDKEYCVYTVENKKEHVRTFGPRLKNRIEAFFVEKVKMQES